MLTNILEQRKTSSSGKTMRFFDQKPNSPIGELIVKSITDQKLNLAPSLVDHALSRLVSESAVKTASSP